MALVAITWDTFRQLCKKKFIYIYREGDIYIYIHTQIYIERVIHTKNLNCISTISRGSRAGTWDFQFLLCGKHYLFDPPKPFSFSIRLSHILAGHMAVQIRDSISQSP